MKIHKYTDFSNESLKYVTHWSKKDVTITLDDVIKYLDEKNISTEDINTESIRHLLIETERNPERIEKSSLEFPIILVKKDGKLTSILDGHHRLVKCLQNNIKTIKARILDLNNADKEYNFMFESIRDLMTPKSEDEIKDKVKKMFKTDDDIISIKVWNPSGYILVSKASGIEEENYRVNYHKLTGHVLKIYYWLKCYLVRFPGETINNIEGFLIKDINNLKYIRKFENFNVSLPIETNNDNMEQVYERIDAKMDIPQDVLDFYNLFNKKGYKLFVVGGAVRDYLMGKMGR